MKNESPSKNSYNLEYNNKIEITNDIYIKPKWGLEKINIMSITDEIQINKNEDIEINYLIKTFFENKNKNIFILILLPIIIISELYYRNSLYIYSISFEFNLQNLLSNNILSFFKFITKAGCEYFTFISLIVLFFCFSLIHAFVCFFGITICIYTQGLLKIIYGDSRPFMENQALFKGICDGGFGNPSGHALLSFFIYLILIHFIQNHKFFNDKIFIKFFLILFVIIMLILVILSRIILGVHSINQIIYGSLLGIWLFYVLIYMFKLDKMSMIIYRKIYQNTKYIILIIICFIITILTPIICSFIFNQQLDYINLNNKLNYNCKKVKKFRRFNYDSLFGCLIIISFMGFYCGQFLFWHLLDKYYKKNIDKLNNDYYLIDELINNWNKNKSYFFTKKGNILKFLNFLFICVSPIILFFLISSENNSMILIFLVKLSIPLFLISFFVFGIGFYWFIILYCGNKDNLLNNYYQINLDYI